MKFMSILLVEGRKEDLRAKYIKSMDPEVLDWILGISDLQDFNHKYTDFVLRTLNKDSEELEDDMEVLIGLVKDFNKYQSQLEKKDINQYKNAEELDAALFPFKVKEKEKELENQAEKIYEDDQFVVVIPKSEEASCKYGAGTRWCTTSKGSGHFGRYTSGSQLLFYIINKKKSKGGNYDKVAVHFDNSGKESWWDTQDTPMNQREIDVFKYAFSEVVDAILNYKKNHVEKTKNQLLYQVFSNDRRYDQLERFLVPDTKLGIGIDGFENIEGMPGHATGELTIYLKKNDESKVVDSYSIMIVYGDVIYDQRFERNVFRIDVGFSGNDPSEESDYLDLGLENLDLKSTMILDGVEKTADGIRIWLSSRVKSEVENNSELQKKVTGGQAVFTSTYGYTFGRNKGMISKLIKYLDSEKIGTKLDFLTDIGYLEKIVKDGKTKYKRGNFTFEPRELRGQHASFFAAAKNAGILNYRKVGRDFLLTKGPNFDAYKEGRLKAL
jgi:hypothetical protein